MCAEGQEKAQLSLGQSEQWSGDGGFMATCVLEEKKSDLVVVWCSLCFGSSSPTVSAR